MRFAALRDAEFTDWFQVLRNATPAFVRQPIRRKFLSRTIDEKPEVSAEMKQELWRFLEDDVEIGANTAIFTLLDRQGWQNELAERATRYLLQMQAGESPLNTINPTVVTDEQVAQAEPPHWLVQHISDAPTLLVVTVDLALIASMDKDLERIGLVSGGSIYPLAWNMLLAARNEGYGGTITTWGIAREPDIQALLGMPEHWAVAAIMPLGKPVKQLTRLKRKPVEEILFGNRWDGAH